VPVEGLTKVPLREHGMGSSSSRRRWEIGCLIVIAAICLARACYRGLPIVTGAIDLTVALDGGWRVLNGQRPHVDYYSALGPISQFITAFGLALANHAVRGLNYASAILGFLISLWSLAIARSRMAPPWEALTGIFFALLIVAPAPLGLPFDFIGEAMFYNRYGYALMAIILIESYLAPRDARSSPAGGFSTGLACCVLLFLKASYFFAAAALIGSMLLIRRQNKERLIGVCLGFGAALTIMLAYLGFHAGAMVGDLRMAAAARAQGMFAPGHIGIPLRGTFVSNMSLLVMAGLAGLVSFNAREDWRGRIPAWCWNVYGAALVIGAGMALLATNWQFSSAPLNAVFAIVLADAAMRNVSAGRHRANPSPLWSGIVLAVWALFLSVPMMAWNVQALVVGFEQSGVPKNSPQVSLIHSGVMSDMRLMGWSRPWINGAAYATELNDGISLLERSSPATETVYTLDYADLFGYALQRKPARGGSTWLHPEYNFSDHFKPSPEWLLGYPDVVMVPKPQCRVYSVEDPPCFRTEYIQRNYFGYLSSRFRLVAESEYWQLYRRNRE